MVGDRLREDVGGCAGARDRDCPGTLVRGRRFGCWRRPMRSPTRPLTCCDGSAQPENRRFVKSCGEWTAAVTIPEMTDSLLPTTPTELPLRPQDEVECRRCEVHCDKVVYPGACVERACAFVYAYEAFGHTYMGCMQRVFDVEIDLDLLRAAEAPAGRASAPSWHARRRCRCATPRSSPATSSAATRSAAAIPSSPRCPSRARASGSSRSWATDGSRRRRCGFSLFARLPRCRAG